MLPKTMRVSRKLFDYIFKNGKIYNTEHFYLKAYGNPPGGSGHFSIVIPKKIVKKPTSRNLIRRRVYMAIRDVLSTSAVDASGIFFVKTGICNLGHSEIKEELKKLFCFLNTINTVK